MYTVWHTAPWSSFSCRACTPCSAVPQTCTPVPGKLIVSNITVVNVGQCRESRNLNIQLLRLTNTGDTSIHTWMDGGTSGTLNNQGNFNGSMMTTTSPAKLFFFTFRVVKFDTLSSPLEASVVEAKRLLCSPASSMWHKLRVKPIQPFSQAWTQVPSTLYYYRDKRTKKEPLSFLPLENQICEHLCPLPSSPFRVEHSHFSLPLASGNSSLSGNISRFKN